MIRKKIGVILLIFTVLQLHPSYKITVLGTGYVGLVSGTCLAQMGHKVTCVDIDQSKIDQINNGIIPIYEPGLSDLVTENSNESRLYFSGDIPSAIKNAEIIMVAVNTPSQKNGQADLTALENAIQMIISHSNEYKLIIIKSTVPVGTNKLIREKLNNSLCQFDLVSNPEFLREGTAIYDCISPDRIVIGSTSQKAIETMKELYRELLPKTPLVITDLTTAEAIKYASNTFLAVKISFINELANLCDATGAHVATIAHAMGLDTRISPHFLKPGPGFGGSCFPKDSQALAYTSEKEGTPMLIVEALLKANEFQKQIPVIKLKKLLGNNLKNKNIAILGLAFKANTDDIRYSPAITTIKELVKEGAIIKAYDPQAIPNMKKLFPEISYAENVYEALKNCDATVILTEWQEFVDLDLGKAANLMTQKVIVDCRNILDPIKLTMLGFRYQTIGNGGTKNLQPDYYFCSDPIELFYQ